MMRGSLAVYCFSCALSLVQTNETLDSAEPSKIGSIPSLRMRQNQYHRGDPLASDKQIRSSTLFLLNEPRVDQMQLTG